MRSRLRKARRGAALLRLLSLLMVLSQSVAVVVGATPWAAGHCECTHGPDVPCDCAHHLGALGRASDEEDESLPPCHRKKVARPPAAPVKQDEGNAPVVKNHCGASTASLVLCVAAPLPLLVLRPVQTPVARAASLPQADALPLERSLSPPTPPPRAGT